MSCYAIGCGDVRYGIVCCTLRMFLVPGRTCLQHPHHIFFVFFSRANIGIGILLLYTNILDRYYIYDTQSIELMSGSFTLWKRIYFWLYIPSHTYFTLNTHWSSKILKKTHHEVLMKYIFKSNYGTYECSTIG